LSYDYIQQLLFLSAQNDTPCLRNK